LSQQQVCKEFGVSRYLVKKARQLKKAHGILASPDKKQGKVLPQEVVQAVIEFYQDEDISRMCPCKKEFVSVKENGMRIQKQKRLLLLNLRELHIEFKKRNS